MRKDLRIGLGVGGVLLAIFVVVLIFKSNKTSNQTAQTEPSTSDTEMAPGTGDPATTPEPTETPTIVNAEPTSPPVDPTAEVFSHPPPQPAKPTSPPAPSASAGHDPWNDIMLRGGMMDSPAPIVLPAVDRPAPSSRKGRAIEQSNLPSEPAAAETPTKASDWFGPPISEDTHVPTPTAVVQRRTERQHPAIATPGAASNGRTHIVQDGESFSSIARTAYGNGKYYLQIEQANPDVNPNRLRPGQTIQLPSIESASARSISPRGDNVGRGTGTAANVRSVDRNREYIVVSGDSLYRISEKLYGDASHLDSIYDVNRSTIGGDPERLKIGMRLKLPMPPTSTASQ